ncbi:hypothetical protein ES703_35147 [subsurface metagenome]
MAETKGHCKHGEFIIRDGCPQCIAERRQAEVKGTPTPDAACEEYFTPPEAEPPDETCATEEELRQMEREATAKATAEPAAEGVTALALRPGEDLEAHGYFEEALKLLKYAEGRVIATVEDNKAANDDLSLISKLKKAMENKRRSLLDPLKAEAEAIRETYSTLMDPVFRADKITRDKMLAYDAKQRQIRAEQEEINRKRREAAEAEMRLKGELSESVNLVEVAPEPAKSVSTEMGTTGMTDHWKWEVVDFALLPDEYKVVDSSLLTAVAKKHHDQKPVPGVRFYNEPIIAVRAR